MQMCEVHDWLNGYLTDLSGIVLWHALCGPAGDVCSDRARVPDGGQMENTLALNEPLDFTNSLSAFAVEGDYLERQRRKSVRERELGLMLAILEDAVNCYIKYASARDRRGRRQFQEAEEWIFQSGSDWLFSFENICEILGIDPEYLRQGLLGWKEKVAADGQGGRGRSLSSKAA